MTSTERVHHQTIQHQTKENTAKQNPRRQNSLTSTQSTYIVAVHRAIQKYMMRHFAKASMTYFDPEDLASYATELIMAKLGTFMSKYPDPIAGAHAVARNAAWDHQRRVRVQRGEGARGERAVVGLQDRIRRGDEDSPTYEELLVSTYANPEDIVDRIDAEREIAEVLDEFTPVGLEGVLAIEIDGRTQGEIAKGNKVRRETVNRAIKQGQERARKKREANARKKQSQVNAARAAHARKRGKK